MSFRTHFAALFTLVGANLSAQEAPFTCSTHGLEHLSSFLEGHPERLAQIQAADAALEQHTQHFINNFDERGGGQIVIPVVFHIIHNNDIENISDEQVVDAVRVLNDDFNKLNADWENVRDEFLPIVANVGITFRLAGYDPDGNCTKGITRTVSELTNDGGQDMKDLIQWPRDQYLNIWVCAYAQGAAGYTQTPGNVDAAWAADADGIVVLHSYTGSIGTSSPGRSRTLTHEVGHWINLRHTWGPTNDPGLPENCDVDDNVSDTPLTVGWTSCNLNGASCDSPLDNVENYMEYSYCSKMFTNGQKARMIAALNSGTADRNNLWTEANLIATGCTDVQPLCSASFVSDRRTICAGQSVSFTDQSFHGVISRTWNFAGGEPATADAASTVITYNTPGIYPVELTVSNGQDSETSTVNDYIMVLADPGQPAPFAEGFEAMDQFDPALWANVNTDGDLGTFSVRSDAAYSGTKSIRMKNNQLPAGLLDELLSPSIDLSQAQAVNFSFRYAFARRASDNDDKLRIYVSKDCGETWVLRKQLRGNGELPTVPDQTSTFIPNGAGQWELCTITNITSDYAVENFRFKFWFTGDGGNDLWIDDININGTPVGLDETIAAGGVLVSPNPATSSATLSLQQADAANVRVELLDLTGRTIAVVAQGRTAAGLHRWELPVRALNSGVYLVRVMQDARQQVLRFTKE